MTNLNDNVTLLNIANTTSHIETTLDSNFLPAGTTFNIKTDGTGDFTSLVDAINHLRYKYSNGFVKFQIGEGTFDVPGSTTIDGNFHNIHKIIIEGLGVDTTILSCNTSNSWEPMINIINSVVDFRNLTVLSTHDQSKTSTYGGLAYLYCSDGLINNVKTIGCGNGILARNGSRVVLENYQAYNGGAAITAIGSTINCNTSTNITVQNCNIVYNSVYGSIISGESAKQTLSGNNVTYNENAGFIRGL